MKLAQYRFALCCALSLFLIACLAFTSESGEKPAPKERTYSLEEKIELRQALKALSSPHEEDRMHAVYTIFEHRASEHRAKAVALLRTDTPKVKSRVLTSLCRHPDPRFAKQVAPFTSSMNRDHRHYALLVLGYTKARQHTGVVLAALKHKERWTRFYAIKALMCMRATESLGRIKEMAKDPDKDVRSKAEDAIFHMEEKAKIWARSCKQFKSPDAKVRLKGLEAIDYRFQYGFGHRNRDSYGYPGRLGGREEPIPELAALLSDPSSRVRYAAARLFSSMGIKAHADAVAALLTDKYQAVRIAAATTLGEMGAKQYAPAVARLLLEEDKHVRRCAVKVLAQFKVAKYNKTIALMLKDSDERVRSAAISALADLKAREYSKPIAGMLEDREVFVRASALGALGDLQAEEHTEDIAAFLTDWSLQGSARSALRKMKRPPSPAIIYKAIKPAVVHIVVTFTRGGKEFKGLGTGYFIDRRGLILTNQHVLVSKDARFKSMRVKLHSGRVLETEDNFYTHKELDIGMVKIKNPKKELFPCLSLEGNLPEVGSAVYALGHPQGLSWSFTEGKVSQVRRGKKLKPGSGLYDSRAYWIQTDTAINQGNSGGPLVDAFGRVRGMVTLKKVGKTIEGLGFALAVKSFTWWRFKVGDYWLQKKK